MTADPKHPGPQLYVKKSTPVKAEQFHKYQNCQGVWGWQENAHHVTACLPMPHGSFEVIGPAVITPQNRSSGVNDGDWVVDSGDGIHYEVVRNDVFIANYRRYGEIQVEAQIVTPEPRIYGLTVVQLAEAINAFAKRSINSDLRIREYWPHFRLLGAGTEWAADRTFESPAEAAAAWWSRRAPPLPATAASPAPKLDGRYDANQPQEIRDLNHVIRQIGAGGWMPDELIQTVADLYGKGVELPRDVISLLLRAISRYQQAYARLEAEVEEAKGPQQKLKLRHEAEVHELRQRLEASQLEAQNLQTENEMLRAQCERWKSLAKGRQVPASTG